MIIQDIVNILKADVALKTLLGASQTDTHIYPFTTSIRNNCILYKLTPYIDEDIKRTYRLEIQVVSNDIENLYAIETRVTSLLLTIGDKPNIGMLNVVANGGSSEMSDTLKNYHLIRYYYITTRSN